MTNDVTNVEEEPTEAVNPQQFRLLDLFALMTLVAVVSAMAAPILHGFDSGFRSRFLVAIVLQMFITAGTLVYYARKRKRLLEKAGAKMGTAVLGNSRWRTWSRELALLVLLFTLFGQLNVTATMAFDMLYLQMGNGPFSRFIDILPVSHRVLHYLHYFSFLDYFVYLNFSVMTGYVISRCRWQTYPFTFEVFENGISSTQGIFTSWEHIEVRSSSSYPDKTVFVIRAPHPLIGGSTMTVRVSKQLRERVFAAAKAAETV